MPVPTYLQRHDIPGEALHGPFPGPIVFGTDPQRCQMVLNAAGIAPVHATLGPLEGGQYTLAPEAPDLELFLRPPGRDQMWPVDSPVSAKVGSILFFGSADGPSFVICYGDPSPARTAVDRDSAMDMMGALERALAGAIPPPAAELETEPLNPGEPGPVDITQVLGPASELGPVSGAPRWIDRVRGRGWEPGLLAGCGATFLILFLASGALCSGVVYLLLDAFAAQR